MQDGENPRMIYALVVAVIALKFVLPLRTTPYRNFLLAMLGTIVLIVGPTLIEVMIGGKGVLLTWLALIYSPIIIVVLFIIYQLIDRLRGVIERQRVQEK